MLKVYTSLPATSTTLIPEVDTGYVVVISNLELCTPTAATLTFILYDDSDAIAGKQVYTTTNANESVTLDSIKVIPAGYSLTVSSNQTDSIVTAYGSYSLNNA